MVGKLGEALRYGVTLLVLVAFFFGGGVMLKGVLGTDYPMMVVVSQSMVPTLGVGDFIFVGAVDTAQIETGPAPRGDVIVFLRPALAEDYIVHRAIQRSVTGGVVTYSTKGDNNYSADQWKVPPENIHGKVVANVPLLGYFSVFIKTLQGFGFVLGLMLVSYAFDYALPARRAPEGRFPPWAATPLFVAPLSVATLFFIDGGIGEHLTLELAAVGAWYFSCLLIPLAFHDDDSGTMVWLYETVLLMIPIACDMVWWTKKITPSLWWDASGGAIQTNWALLKTNPVFDTVFQQVLLTIGPGVLIFLVALYAKRRGVEPLASWGRRLRGVPPSPPTAEPESREPEVIPVSQQT